MTARPPQPPRRSVGRAAAPRARARLSRPCAAGSRRLPAPRPRRAGARRVPTPVPRELPPAPRPGAAARRPVPCPRRRTGHRCRGAEPGLPAGLSWRAERSGPCGGLPGRVPSPEIPSRAVAALSLLSRPPWDHSCSQANQFWEMTAGGESRARGPRSCPGTQPPARRQEQEPRGAAGGQRHSGHRWLTGHRQQCP